MAYVFTASLFLILICHQQGVLTYSCPEAVAISSPFPKISGIENENMVLPELSETLNCSCQYISEGLHIDCSKRKFLTVPKLPFNTIVAIFSHNLINEIQSSAFTTTNQLVELDLSYNMINNIARGAFKGLVNLQRLFIRESNLEFLTAEELNILIEDLTSLNNLTVTLGDYNKINHIDYKYNKRAVAQLPLKWRLGRIETLTINAEIVCQLSEEDHLKLGDSWDVKYLTLYNVDLHFCQRFTQRMFMPMKQLVSLTIFTTMIECYLVNFDNNTFSENINLEEFAVNADCSKHSATGIIRNISQSLVRATKLHKLEISGFIKERSLQSDVLSALNSSRTLSTLILNQNSLKFPDSLDDDCYHLPVSVTLFSALSSCITLDNIGLLLSFNMNLATVNISVNTALESCGMNTNIDKTLSVTNMTQRRWEFNDTCNLKVLRYTNNPYRFAFDLRVSIIPIPCLQSLQYLDMSYNVQIYVDPISFNVCYNLEYLDFTGCRLRDTVTVLLRNFTKIKFLYLSDNSIESEESVYATKAAQRSGHLTDDSFTYMKNLQVIDLSFNKLKSFKPSLRGIPNLQLLNISGNNIKVLTSQNMKELDQLADKKANVILDLSKQTLWCTCETIEFLEWIQVTKTTLAFRDTYECDFPKNTNITNSLIQHLKKSCSSYGTYIIVSSIGVTLCLVFIAMALGYRYRWRLRYLFFMAKLNMNISAKKKDYEQIYEYDAFISYASEDFELARTSVIENLEVKKGLKLCVHERDFKPGDSIAFNISRGIHASKRTLLFLSKAFFASEWCKYEINIARMETLYKQRDVVLAIMLEDVPQNNMNVAILDFINTSTYLEYPKNNRKSDVELFWNKCHDFIVKD